ATITRDPRRGPAGGQEGRREVHPRHVHSAAGHLELIDHHRPATVGTARPASREHLALQLRDDLMRGRLRSLYDEAAVTMIADGGQQDALARESIVRTKSEQQRGHREYNKVRNQA